MTYKEAFERLRTQVQAALTDYEDFDSKHNDTLDRLENAQWFYGLVVDIVNATEHWEFDSPVTSNI